MSKQVNVDSLKFFHQNWISRVDALMNNEVVNKKEIILSDFNFDFSDKLSGINKVSPSYKQERFLEIKNQKLINLSSYIWYAKFDGNSNLSNLYHKDIIAVSNRIINYCDDILKYEFIFNEKGVINF
jgi:hypothetical protein